MTSSYKDKSRISLAFAALFFVAVLIAAYMLYSLPTRLSLISGYESILFKTYGAVAIAFAIGGVSIYLALKSNKEIIVYKEKVADENNRKDDDSDDSRKSTISLEGVRASLAKSKNEKDFYQHFMQAVCTSLEAGQGALYLSKEEDDIKKVALMGGYALSVGESTTIEFDFGEGLIGQAAAEGRSLYVDDVPEGYIKIVSGLGSASPRYLFITPAKKENTVTGVLEIASFKPFTDDQRKFVEEAAHLFAEKITTE